MARDLAGMRFGRLTVLNRAADHITAKGYHHIMWNCICDCGVKCVIRGKSLTGNVTRSCGCLQKEQIKERASKHNGFGTRLYNIWNSMRQRCNNPNHRSYHNYGGRGIKICAEWDDFNIFRAWALSAGYDETAVRGKCTLDRIDVDSGYSPNNCRFINMREQADNRRGSIILEHDGETHPLTVWAEILGIKYPTLWKRYRSGREIFNN